MTAKKIIKNVNGYGLKTIGDKFKFLRQELTEGDGKNGKSMSLRELANAISNLKEFPKTRKEYSHSRIERIENNKSDPTILDLKLYHTYFDVPYEFLLGETDSLEYENLRSYDDLGLSDKSINRLIYINTPENKQKIYLDLINCIFDSGLDERFFSLLTEYFFGDIKKEDIGSTFKDSDTTKFEINIVVNKNKIIRKEALSIEEVNSIYKNALFEKLNELKNNFKNKGYIITEGNKDQRRLLLSNKEKEKIYKNSGELAFKMTNKNNRKQIKNAELAKKQIQKIKQKDIKTQ
ncbi:helix-turn-helix transcriptional regulator [bacterium]|nr:helix-turn-helix transcriptional regulator [bacterium]